MTATDTPAAARGEQISAARPVPTPTPLLYRSAEECRALAQSLAAPAALALFLQAMRERHARAGLPIPVPALPIDSQLP